MNTIKTQPEPQGANGLVRQETAPVVSPSIDQIVMEICADARKDALKYALRSDTGHDGE